MSGTQSRYTPGYGAHVTGLVQRSAVTHAAFFLSRLQPDSVVLDCGCGPGAITKGLAEVVGDGVVVGCDISTSQIAAATRQDRPDQGTHPFYVLADVSRLPFADNSFDAVFAHTLLMHLAEPQSALREMYRVLKPSGIVGLREEDQGSQIYFPEDSDLRRARSLHLREWQATGGDPYVARKYRMLLSQVGFVDIEIGASATVRSGPEAVRAKGERLSRMWGEKRFVEGMLERGWVQQSEVHRLGDAWRRWGEHPHAFFADLNCEALASKPSEPSR
ncbi:MAG: methyltransferase domain-containing protein [Chloroflexota bacterium]|nr:methyltransferase domain-containing protein [Chloroflexota bacterium]